VGAAPASLETLRAQCIREAKETLIETHHLCVYTNLKSSVAVSEASRECVRVAVAFTEKFKSSQVDERAKKTNGTWTRQVSGGSD
jgi:hypothetical protein